MTLTNRFLTVPVTGMLRRLFVLRLYAITGQLLAIIGVNFALDIRLPLFPMLMVVALMALLNLATWVRLRQPWPVTAMEFFAQLLVDAMALAVLLFYSGGSTNPFVSLYLLPIIIAAITLPALYAWIITILCLAAYSLLMFFYVPLHMPHSAAAFALHVAGMWLNFIASALLITFFIGRMAASIRSREHELAEVRETGLRNETIVALGSLAAGAAHELSTPLATMAVVAGELQYEHGGNPALISNLQILRDQITACKAILNRLTATAGAERAEDTRVLAVDAYLDELVAQWQLMRPAACLQTRWKGARPAPHILATATLGQALLSLFNNAADAAPAVELEACWDRQTLTLDILDRGQGFDREAAARAGEVFFTTKQAQGGFGLGLFLANATVERLGGSVRMLSREGGGAHILVRLPLQVPSAP
ncbi:MAG: ATP-binding protein [Sulfuriferula sp.]